VGARQRKALESDVRPFDARERLRASLALRPEERGAPELDAALAADPTRRGKRRSDAMELRALASGGKDERGRRRSGYALEERVGGRNGAQVVPAIEETGRGPGGDAENHDREAREGGNPPGERGPDQ